MAVHQGSRRGPASSASRTRIHDFAMALRLPGSAPQGGPSMKLIMLLSLSVCIAACAAEIPDPAGAGTGDDQATATSELATPVFVAARASDGLAAIHAAAIAASAPACHASIPCNGPVIGPVFVVDCGPVECSTQG